MKKIIFATVLWGDNFRFMFTRFGLPSLLADGNLEEIAKLAPVEFRIYTSPDDARLMMGQPALARLEEMVPTRFVFLGESDMATARANQDGAYKLMVETHRHAIKDAWEMDAGLCLTYPDAFMTEGSMREVARHVNEGKRAVMAPGISLALESFAPAMMRRLVEEGRFAEFKDGILRLQPRPLVKMMTEHLHDHSVVQQVGRPDFTTWPSILFWSMGAHGWLARPWHLNPMIIHPRRDGSDFKTSSDGDFVGRAVDGEDVAFLTDSDSFLIVEQVTLGRRRAYPPGINHARPFDVAHWAMSNTDAISRGFVRQKFWYHDGETSLHAETERASDEFLDQVFATLDTKSRFDEGLKAGFADLLPHPLG